MLCLPDGYGHDVWSTYLQCLADSGVYSVPSCCICSYVR